MPIQSEKQRRFMEAVRHNPDFAKKAGVSKAVAEKFVGPKAHADGGRVEERESDTKPLDRRPQGQGNLKFRKDEPSFERMAPKHYGPKPLPPEEREMFAREARKGGVMKAAMKKESPAMMKKEVSFMKKKGAPKSMIKHEMAEAKGKPFAKGGGIESKGKAPAKKVKMMGGGKC